MKINIPIDCGNAPKRGFIKDMSVAFASTDMDFLTESVTDDIVWDIIGDTTVEGKDNFQKVLKERNNSKVRELTLDKILTHGKEGAVSGNIKTEEGKSYAFSDFYEFRGAKGNKVKAITSYVIEI